MKVLKEHNLYHGHLSSGAVAQIVTDSPEEAHAAILNLANIKIGKQHIEKIEFAQRVLVWEELSEGEEG